MMKALVFLLLGLLAAPAFAQKPLVPIKGTVTFQIRNAGVNVEGYFEGLSIEGSFSSTELQSSYIKGTIPASTINTGIGSRDHHLKKAEYFDVQQFPLIFIASKSISAKGDGAFEGVFSLTIKGVTHDITIPFTVSEKNGELLFKASFSIRRTDFGIGGNSWTMSDTAKINVEFTATY